MKASLIFRIQRWLRFILQGVGKRENEHYLFTLETPLTDFELYSHLADPGWQPNYMGYVYKGQIYQCRRLVDKGRHQYHVRCYDGGKVTGHFEVSPEQDERLHLRGADLRTMDKHEAEGLKNTILKEGTL